MRARKIGHISEVLHAGALDRHWARNLSRPGMPVVVVETYSEPSQTSKMKSFAKTVNGFYPLTVFKNRSILDA